MRSRLVLGLVLAAVAIAAAAAPAGAAHVVDARGLTIQPEQRWLDAASIDYGPRTATLIYGGCPRQLQDDERAFSCYVDATRTLYLLPLPRPARRLTLLHEFAHVWQDQAPAVVVNAVTARFREINRYPDVGVWTALPGHEPTSSTPGLIPSVGEILADAIMWCAVHPRVQWSLRSAPADSTGSYGWRPTAKQVRATCTMLARNLPR